MTTASSDPFSEKPSTPHSSKRLPWAVPVRSSRPSPCAPPRSQVAPRRRNRCAPGRVSRRHWAPQGVLENVDIPKTPPTVEMGGSHRDPYAIAGSPGPFMFNVFRPSRENQEDNKNGNNMEQQQHQGFQRSLFLEKKTKKAQPPSTEPPNHRRPCRARAARARAFVPPKALCSTCSAVVSASCAPRAAPSRRAAGSKTRSCWCLKRMCRKKMLRPDGTD